MTGPHGHDGFQQGVQAWLNSMESSRRALEELGRSMGNSIRAGAPVTAADLERVVSALSLIEQASRESRDRLSALEASNAALQGKVDSLQEQLTTLTGAVSTLVDRVVAGAKS